VKLRFFAGLTADEASQAMGISADRGPLLGICPCLLFRRFARRLTRIPNDFLETSEIPVAFSLNGH
jgi:hypothetical protein